ncbi:MAG: hypothetical protein NTY57_08015 [Solirubrobacterales bacterium]|nr:hypothetical protein [Solirubrobacterales bacterium]
MLTRVPAAAVIVSAAFAATAMADGQAMPNVYPTEIVPVATHGPAGAAGAPATLTVTKCATSSVLANRRLEIQAHMLAVTGTVSMQIRPHLFYKPVVGAERELKVAGSLGDWEPAISVSATRNWIFNKKIDSLPSPAKYRMEVDYQWNGTGSKVVKRQTLRTVSCNQPDYRPNLTITGVTTSLILSGNRLRYAVTVRNNGKGTALAAQLRLMILPAATPFYYPVDSRGNRLSTGTIKAGESKVLTIDAPSCFAGSTALIEVDPGNLLAESNGDDNIWTGGCWLPD